MTGKHSCNYLLPLIANVTDRFSLAVVVYGYNKLKPCDVEILRPLAPINGEGKAEITRCIKQSEPSGSTPICNSLQVAAEQVNQSRTASLEEAWELLDKDKWLRTPVPGREYTLAFMDSETSSGLPNHRG